MPNDLFDIPQPPSNSVSLDGQRKGRVQFTVNNVSGRPLRIGARLTAVPDNKAEYGKWLKLDGETIRVLPIAGSQQYTALVEAPAVAKAGSYVFQLDVWDEDNPEDTLASSPSVTFTVPAPKPPTPFPWWILVIAGVVILLIAVGGVFLFYSTQHVPTATPTFTTTATLTPTPTATPTPTLTPTSTATPTPVLLSGGLLTYKVKSGSRSSIFAQGVGGAPVRLIANKDDVEILAYTPKNGGRFAIWALEGAVQKIYIVDLNGSLVGNPITGVWTTIDNADWSNDGQSLIVEASTGSAVNYYYYDANGSLLAQPVFP